jgi:hypothetical protein
MSSSELTALRTFVKRLFLFFLPCAIYAGFICACDPFNFISTRSLISDQVKLPLANVLNMCLLKMIRLRREPAPNIMLGDSRMLEILDNRVSQMKGERYANMAYGGASLRECIETFWFASRLTQLHQVYLGVDLEIYNDYNLFDRTETYRSVEDNPALYFINRTVFQASAYSAYTAFTRKTLKLDAVNVDRKTFWNNELNGPQTTRLLQNYLYPTNYHAELLKIGSYAKQHGIDLTFVIFPTHTDYQARFEAFGLQSQQARMREDLAAIAPVIDFDYPNDLTRDEANFRDPVHLAQHALTEITDEIWGQRGQLARRYPSAPGSKL